MSGDRIDKLAEDWSAILIEEAHLKKRKQAVIEGVLSHAPYKARGVEKVTGDEHAFEVTFRQNVSYKDKDALEKLVEDMPNGLELFRIDLKERLSEVEKFIEADTQASKELVALRTVKQGAPSLKMVR